MIRRVAVAAAAVLALWVAVASVPAMTMDPAAWPQPMRHAWSTRTTALFTHMATAVPALLLGPAQFLVGAGLHRWIGALYAALATVAALSGISLGLSAYGGPVAQAGFVAMGTVWLACTWMGVQRFLEGRPASHAAWMTASYAMAFGAVTLRLQILAIAHFHLPSAPAYAAASWLCWLPNLAVALAVARVRSRIPRPGATG